MFEFSTVFRVGSAPPIGTSSQSSYKDRHNQKPLTLNASEAVFQKRSNAQPMTLFSSWTWKGFRDAVEYTSGLTVIGCGVWGACESPESRQSPAIVAGIAGASGLTAKAIGQFTDSRKRSLEERKNQERIRQATRAMLESMQRFYFKDEDKIDLHKHRFTLFRLADEVEGGGGVKYLVLFARAGDHTDSSRRWPVNEGQAALCRGVAGEVWFKRTTIFREAECDWLTDGALAQKTAYATSLGMTLEGAKSLNVKSRAFAGALVTVGGKRWGVLLLDSLTAESLKNTPARKLLLDSYATMLGNVLMEATL